MHSQHANTRTNLTHIAQVALVVLTLPLVLGTSCPFIETCSTFPVGNTDPLGNNDPLTLTAGELPDLPQSVLAAVCTSGPDAFKILSFNGAANRIVTIQVHSDTSNSRPQVIVYDHNNGNILAQNATQTADTVTTAFTPNASQTFIILIKECGDVSQATAKSTAYFTTIPSNGGC